MHEWSNSLAQVFWLFYSSPDYCSTFSSSPIIKLFFENVKLFRNYQFEVPKFKKIARDGKIQRQVETREPLPLGQSTCRASIEQITTFFCPLICVEHCVSPFLQKRCVKNVVKSLIMLKVQSPENCQRSCLFFIA